MAIRMLVLAVVTPALVAQTSQSPPRPPEAAEVATSADRIVKGFDAIGSFSGVVLIAQGDRVIYQGAAGWANPEFGIRNTTETVFRIVSLSSLFTATAILKLQEDGKLRVTDAASKYLSDWPASHAEVTIHQLLTGESGIRDVTQIREFVRTVAVERTPQQLASLILKEPPAAAPGTFSPMMNSNYHLLAAIIERAAGLSTTEYIRRELFVPLGLSKTAFDSPDDIVEGRATGLVRRTDQSLRHGAWMHMSNAIGRADLRSTVGDVHRFLRALLSGRVVAPAAVKTMTTDHVPTRAQGIALAPGMGYGMSVLAGTPAIPGRLLSAGTIGPFWASWNHNVDADLTILVLSNMSGASDFSNIGNELAAMIAGRPFAVPVKRTAVPPRKDDLAALEGVWEVPDSFSISPSGARATTTLTLRVDGQRLWGSFGGEAAEWFAEGPGRFFLGYTDQQIVIEAGTVSRITFGRKQALRKRSPSM